MSERAFVGTRIPVDHNQEDNDSGVFAGHHTLGIYKYQGSPGNHRHTEDDPLSIPLFSGTEVTITAGESAQSQLDKIWTIFEEFGATVNRITP